MLNQNETKAWVMNNIMNNMNLKLTSIYMSRRLAYAMVRLKFKIYKPP